MAHRQESLDEIVVAASSSEAQISVWDWQTGAAQRSFSVASCQRNGLCQVGRNYFAAAQIPKGDSRKGAISLWSWHKAAADIKSGTEECISALTATSDGLFLAAGSVSGHVYVWEVSTSRLLRFWSAHYKEVTCLKFTDDDSMLVSASADTFVKVTPLIRILDGVNQPGAEGGGRGGTDVRSLFTWSFHRLAITGLFVGAGGINSTLVSCSLDHQCAVWSMSLGGLLCMVDFKVAIHSVVVDPGEYAMYAGGSDGFIYVFVLNSTMPVVQGTAKHTVHGRFQQKHSMAVTALEFAGDGVRLISASEDGNVCIWDTTTRQLLRTLQARGPVNSILVIPRPSAFSSEMSRTEVNKRNFTPLPWKSLREFVDPSSVGLKDSKPWEEAPVMISPWGAPHDVGFDGFDAGLDLLQRSSGAGEGSWSFSADYLSRTFADMEEGGLKSSMVTQNAQTAHRLEMASNKLCQLFPDIIQSQLQGSPL